MGTRGPAPAPARVKRLNGNPGKRRIQDEVEPPPLVDVLPASSGDDPADFVPPPAHLTGYAADEWRKLVRDLLAIGILSRIDHGMLESYCVARSEFVIATLDVDKRGLIVTDKNGTERRNPSVIMRHHAIEQITTLAREFGLTPASRARNGHRLTPETVPLKPASAGDDEVRGSQAGAGAPVAKDVGSFIASNPDANQVH